MTSALTGKVSAAASSLYLLCGAFFLLAIANNHLQLILCELPLDLNEPSMQVITSTIAEGSNPFAIENQPSRISLYPIAYNTIVAPFTLVFGNTLQLHRAVAAIFILASCALCYLLCRKKSVPRTDSLIAATLFYCVLLYYSTPIASPNSLGLFLFLLALTVPWLQKFSPSSLTASLILGITAFYTKQYFIASLGYIALYVFLAVSKRRALIYGIASILALALSLILINFVMPYYLDNTLFAVQSSNEAFATASKTSEQFSEYIHIYSPLLIALTVFVLYRLGAEMNTRFKKGRAWQKDFSIDLFNLDKPLLAISPEFIWVCCFCSVLIIALILGSNPSNHLTYLFQLISPFLLVGVFSMAIHFPQWKWPFRALVLLTLYNSYSILPTDFSVNEENWQKMRAMLAEADDVYASTLVVPDIMASGGTVYQNGHTPWFPFGSHKPSIFVKTKSEETVSEIWEGFVQKVGNKITNREFDLILMDNWMVLPRSITDSGLDLSNALSEHYELKDQFVLQLPERPGGGRFMLKVYRPISVAPVDEH